MYHAIINAFLSLNTKFVLFSDIVLRVRKRSAAGQCWSGTSRWDTAWPARVRTRSWWAAFTAEPPNRKPKMETSWKMLNICVCSACRGPTKPKALQSTTAAQRPAGDVEPLWRRSRTQRWRTERVQQRSCDRPLLRTSSPSLGSAALPAASPRRTSRGSWSTSASTGEAGRRAAVCSVCSVAPASHPRPPCPAIASSSTRSKMLSATASRAPSCLCRPLLETPRTTMTGAPWTAPSRLHPPVNL